MHNPTSYRIGTPFFLPNMGHGTWVTFLPLNMGPGYRTPPLRISGGHEWKPVQTCSLEDLLLHWYWYLAATTESRTLASGRYASYCGAFLFFLALRLRQRVEPRPRLATMNSISFPDGNLIRVLHSDWSLFVKTSVSSVTEFSESLFFWYRRKINLWPRIPDSVSHHTRRKWRCAQDVGAFLWNSNVWGNRSVFWK